MKAFVIFCYMMGGFAWLFFWVGLAFTVGVKNGKGWVGALSLAAVLIPICALLSIALAACK